jgi:hypothetical protein
MHIIFSRKGFDSGTGCIPNPIMPDGTMISLPIPDRHGTVTYNDLTVAGHNLGKLVTDLKGKRINSSKTKVSLTGTDRAHLDPDLSRDICTRKSDWKAAFGQCGSAAGVLHNNNVGIGDLFLFFGWFRQCEVAGGIYRYVPGALDIHALFGYLRIGSIIQIEKDPIPDWAQEHPHLHGKRQGKNVLYVAADSLGLPGIEHLPGAGTFRHFNQALQLTAPGQNRSIFMEFNESTTPGQNRSIWRVPRWMYPDGEKPPLSAHKKMSRWKQASDDSGAFCYLESVAKGQEFVLDTEHYPEAIEWTVSILSGQ